MLNRRKFLAGASGVGMAMLHAPALAKQLMKKSRVDALLDEISLELLKECPDSATFMGLDTGKLSCLASQLPDRSIAGETARAASCSDRLQRLKSVDRTGLSHADRINLDTVTYSHELAAEGYRNFRFGDNAVVGTWQMQTLSPYIVSQADGSLATIPDFLDTQHKVEDRQGAEAYLERLHQFARNLDGETEIVRRDAGAGVIAPSFILDNVIGQQEAYMAQQVPEWRVVTSLADRTEKQNIAGDWRARAIAICEKEIAPAVQSQLSQFKELRTRATDDAGCWKFKDGDAYYAWALKGATTSSMTPDEIHQAGLEQVKEFDAEMDQLLRAQGLTKGSVADRMTALGKDGRFLYPDTDEGKEALLAYLNDQVAQVRHKLPELFVQSPQADLVIKRVPKEMEAGAPAAYAVDGSLDGKKPAYYYINLQDTERWPKFSLPTLCFHEAIPGHVWQGAYNRSLPTIRSQLMFNAYAEGWALYAEQLADEVGMYTDDPFARLGYLQSIQFRACRLVVDTGLHAKRWTRQQAATWLAEHNGMTLPSAVAEIDRYCAWPGQACGYRVGHLTILKLRELARTSLGARYDIRKFNDEILFAGPTPLSVLEDVIHEFIRNQSV